MAVRTVEEVVFGNPPSSLWQIVPRELADLLTQIQSFAGSGSIKAYVAEPADLDALALADGDYAAALATVAGGGGVYLRSAGVWELVAALPAILTESLAAQQAAEAAELAEAWAAGTEPGGTGTLSAREEADRAKGIVEALDDLASLQALAGSAIDAEQGAQDAQAAAEAAALSLGATAYATRASLPASPAAGGRGYVYADATTANNGLWFWNGTAWVKDAVNALQRSEISPAGVARSGVVGQIIDLANYALVGWRRGDGRQLGPWARMVEATLANLSAVTAKFANISILQLPRSGTVFAIRDESGHKAFWLSDAGKVFIGRRNLSDFMSFVDAADFPGQLTTLRAALYGSTKVLTIGDSVAYGSGSSNAGVYSVWARMRAAFPETDCRTIAIGGQNGRQQAARFGARPAYCTVTGGEIPASGPVTVTALSPPFLTTPDNSAASTTGYLAGVYGTMLRSGGVTTFTRAADGDAVPVTSATSEFRAETRDTAGDLYRDRILVIEVGINNSQEEQLNGTVADEVASIIEHARPLVKGIVVSSILNSRAAPIGSDAYNAVAAANAQLKARWPNYYWDRRAWLVAGYDPSVPQDVIDFGNDVPPSSLMSDAIHPNDNGHLRLFNGLVAYMKMRGLL